MGLRPGTIRPTTDREAEETDNVSLAPYIQTFAKRRLEEHAEVSTLKDLRGLLDSPEADEALAGCAALEGRRERLRLSVRALEQNYCGD